MQPDGGSGQDLTPQQRSLLASSEGDSLLEEGLRGPAAERYVHAALLLEPGNPERVAFAALAASITDTLDVTCANILLESPEPLAPFTAVYVGGAEVCPAVLSYMARNEVVLPEYLRLLIADSLVSHGLGTEALQVLAEVPYGLPDRAERRRTELLYSACLAGGAPARADSILDAAESDGDPELLSLLLHRLGMHLLGNDPEGAKQYLLSSFLLWPAAPVHAASYELLEDAFTHDSDLAAGAADPFYEGGLWNELYEIAVASDDPPSHLYYLAARTRDRLGFYDEAVRMLEDYLARWPDGEDAPNAMIYLGRDIGRTGDWRTGMDVLQEYGTRWPNHYRISNLPWYIGDLLAENRRWEEALPYFRTTVRDHPGNVTADDAHFYLCFGLMETGRVEEAMDELRGFVSRWTGSVYLSSARYWLGRLLLEQGEPEGEDVLQALVEDSPESLPASFARELLGIPPWRPEFTEEPLEDWMHRLGHHPAEPPQEAFRGLFLLHAGLRSYAVGEFLRAEESVGGPDRLAPFYLENDVWERRPISGYSMWDMSGSPSDRPRELWSLRYQRAWPELVLPFCDEYGLDPLFAWAIVRNESMFQPDCYSTAGARGLIQMIPSTSQYLAMEQGWEGYSPDRLYDPEVSLEYGICYIAGVDQGTGGNPVITAASYNGGPHNAVHWGSGDMGTEKFFSLITYNETKAYTQNVHHALVIYRALYE